MISFAKKFLSLALALVLLVGVLPMAAFAATDATVNITVQDGGAEPKVPFTEGKVAVTVGQTVDIPYLTTQMATYLSANGLSIASAEYGDGTALTDFQIKNSNHTIIVNVTHACSDKTWECIAHSKLPSCTEKGEDVYKCKYCGATKTVELDKVAHQYDKKTFPSTCVLQGKTIETCKVCGDKVETTLPLDAANHDGKMGDWYVKTEAKPGVAGVEARKCSACGLEETRPIKALPTEDTVFTVTVKTERDGKTESKSFTVKSGKSFTEKDVLAAIPYYDAEKETYEIAYGAVEPGDAVYANHEIAVKATAKKGSSSSGDGKVVYDLHMDDNHSKGNRDFVVKNVEVGTDMRDLFKDGKMRVPAPYNRHVFAGWLCKNNDKFYGPKDEFDLNQDMYLVAQWKDEAQIYVNIYANGKTDKSDCIDRIHVPGYAVGEKNIPTDDIDIKDYYKNGGKPYKFDGWYTTDGWVLLKANEKHSTAAFFDAPKDVEDTVNLYCMITDKSIGSNSKPDSSNPKTGDESMIFATTAVMLISAGALAVVLMDRKRKNG